jgi:hypothetical protein
MFYDVVPRRKRKISDKNVTWLLFLKYALNLDPPEPEPERISDLPLLKTDLRCWGRIQNALHSW